MSFSVRPLTLPLLHKRGGEDLAHSERFQTLIHVYFFLIVGYPLIKIPPHLDMHPINYMHV